VEGDEWKEWGEVGRMGRWREVGDDVSVSPRDRGVTMLGLDPRRDREIQSVWMTIECG